MNLEIQSDFVELSIGLVRQFRYPVLALGLLRNSSSKLQLGKALGAGQPWEEANRKLKLWLNSRQADPHLSEVRPSLR